MKPSNPQPASPHTMGRARQMDLFLHVAATLSSANAPMTNRELYAAVAQRAGITADEAQRSEPIGRAGIRRSVFQRQVRWAQQSLKVMGLARHVKDKRAVWEWAERDRKGLLTPLPGVALIAFSTRLGVAIWGDSLDVFRSMQEPIALVLSSPPFPLSRPRAYGNPTEAEYVDFITVALEPLVRNLIPGGSITLDLGQDIFIPGTPARSIYLERLVIALHDRLGLSLMDRLVWSNPSRPPGPVRWASLARNQLNASYNPIVWLTNDPSKVRADNRRVLEPHSAKHQRLMAGGGEQRHADYADGAYTMRPGRFGNVTPGKIPRNVLQRGHRCADTDAYRRDAAALGLPTHGAMMPLSIPDLLIRFLSEPGDLVIDPFAGSCTTAMAAQRLGRRWLCVERVMQYLRAGAERFRLEDDFAMPTSVAALRGACA